MNIQRFTAPTSREALSKARAVFGESTLILSNRQTEHGVEVMATAEESLADLEGGASGGKKRPSEAPNYREVASQVEEDADRLAMSTLSFQDYVRERMAKRRQEEAPASKPTPVAPRAASTQSDSRPPRPAATLDPIRLEDSVKSVRATPSAPPRRVMAPMPAQSQEASPAIAEELQAMKEMIEERFNTLAWLGQAKQSPVQSGMMMKMIRAGYSPALSRAILERLPAGLDAQEALRWTVDVLERNLRTDAGHPALHEHGGIYALVGATGVGKTTTAAKLAGLCAQAYGPASVGLITLDTYRVGAHEQLRAYGKMMGVVAHLAHDKAALQDLLGLLAGKKLVLIDTTGIAPRDPRKREMLELLDLPDVQRILVLNAGGHGDTLDEAISCFKTTASQDAILSKTDEAVKMGPVVDASIRHQLRLRGITTGQRVPEDWEAAQAHQLVRMSMRTTPSSAFDPKIGDLPLFFNQAPSAVPAHRSSAHA
ncbi:flagellar biosynthesis protein FlhF [Curvibacter sp. APW13]|uniref:flagellar biosynthesis protein FlhF n=1 Tax=Curvibacter sp. APW13 TaxID=3077236 RepID=UPI0028E040CC|nr:flagellar biosynthesis protein FlhF [Curvibacter sp. APW13]MDT8993033.1 flagellar biosynthesis protein FlhF [Curvibacter sp. APW13]